MFGISPDTLALKPSDVLNQLIQNRQIKAEYDRMELQRELARQQEQEAKQRQRESIAAQRELAQMSESGAMGRLDKQLAAQAAETKPWAPGTKEEYGWAHGVGEPKEVDYKTYEKENPDGSTSLITYHLDPAGKVIIDDTQPRQQPKKVEPTLNELLYQTKETTPEITPVQQPVTTTRKRTKEEMLREAGKLPLGTPSLATVLGQIEREYPKKEEKPAITPAQALSILSDPIKARQLKRSYPDTYKQLEDIVKATFGSSSPLDTNIMDTNW